jgi:hypothetical protein
MRLGCQSQNLSGMTYCETCGTPLAIRCPHRSLGSRPDFDYRRWDDRLKECPTISHSEFQPRASMASTSAPRKCEITTQDQQPRKQRNKAPSRVRSRFYFEDCSSTGSPFQETRVATPTGRRKKGI